MNKKNILIVSLLFSALFTTVISSDDYFKGTWCVGEERLIITFKGNDSLYVTSKKDESMQGNGTYTKTDSTFTATMKNEDLTLVMGYRYQKKTKTMLRAKIAFITVDGDSVNHRRRWMKMEKCDPKKYIFPEDTAQQKPDK